MPHFSVVNAHVEYVGVGYSGPFMRQIGRPHEIASYPTCEEAIRVACELKTASGDQTDWKVVNEFSERVMYDTTKQPMENLTE